MKQDAEVIKKKGKKSISTSKFFKIDEDIMNFFDNYHFVYFHNTFGQDIDHLLNIYKSRKYFYYPIESRSDIEVLRSDWNKVGNDIRVGFRKYKEELPKVHDGRKQRVRAT